MKALGLMVSKKKIFLRFSLYKEEYYTMLHTKYESYGPCGFGEDFFLCIAHCKSMGAICCHGNQSSDPT